MPKMPARPSCCCPQHAVWGHVDDSSNLRVVTTKEMRFCGVNVDGRHNDRRRKKCSKSTVAAARVHAILFGRGGVPPASVKFSRRCLPRGS